jgi:hypothetical protein
MTEEIQISTFNDALNALNTVSEQFKIDVLIPSLNKTLTFKEIDAKQQKSLLSAAMDNSIYNNEFVKIFYQILKDNLLNEDTAIIDTLNVVDKNLIGISLRSQISNELTVNFTEDFSGKIDLSNVISKFLGYITPKNEQLELKNDSVTLVLDIKLPTILDEVSYEQNFHKNYKDVSDLKTNDDVKKLVSDAFIAEISKYVSSIEINSKNISFSTLSFLEKIKIIEKIPSGLIQKVLQKISDWKKDIDSILTVSSKDVIDGKVSETELKKTISIDSLLFLN